MKRPSRWRRLAAWAIVLPALAIVSFAVIAKAAALRGKPDLDAAVSQFAHRTDGAVIVLGSQACWISRGQFTRVSTVFSTSAKSLVLGGTTYTLVAARGVDRAALEQLLGTAVTCRTASSPRLSFMP